MVSALVGTVVGAEAAMRRGVCLLNCCAKAHFLPCSTFRRSLFSLPAVSGSVRAVFNAPRLPHECALSYSGAARAQPLQLQLVSLTKDRGFEGWNAGHSLVSGEKVPTDQWWNVLIGRPRFIVDIADATQDIAASPGEIVDAALSTQGADVGSGELKFDLLQDLEKIFRLPESWRQYFSPGDSDGWLSDWLIPQFAPDSMADNAADSATKSADPVTFALVSVSLFSLFWFGNFYLPEKIFKDTFKKTPDESKEGDPSNPTGNDSKEGSGQILTSRNVVTGFGKSKEKRLKGARKRQS